MVFSQLLPLFGSKGTKQMTKLEKPISEFVDNLELLLVPFAEHKINGAVNSYIKEKNKKELPPPWLAEAMAFDFVQNYQNKETSLGAHTMAQ